MDTFEGEIYVRDIIICVRGWSLCNYVIDVRFICGIVISGIKFADSIEMSPIRGI